MRNPTTGYCVTLCRGPGPVQPLSVQARLADGIEREVSGEEVQNLGEMLGLEPDTEVEMHFGGLTVEELSPLMRGVLGPY